jgi:GDPmannose 4,6-dehydratase
MWRMLQQETPDDFVLASGITYSIREIAECVYEILGGKLKWIGEGLEEKGVDVNTGKTIISVDPKYFRPTEVEVLIGNPNKAKEILGWERKMTIREILEEMVNDQINKK